MPTGQCIFPIMTATCVRGVAVAPPLFESESGLPLQRKKMRARTFDFARFHFTLTLEDEWGDESLKNYTLTMMEGTKSVKSNKIGSIQGYLIDRKVGGFFERCDAISSELQVAGCLCCDNRGNIRPTLSNIISNERRVALASRGGFLYINEVIISKKARRGSDLGLIMLQALFHNLAKRFTLAVLFPAPWDIADREREKPDRQRGNKIIKIARHFAPVGFAPIAKSGYMFVEQSQIPQNILTKEATSRLDIPLHAEPAERNLSDLDKELIDSLGDIEQVKILIANGADPKNSDALHHACARQLPLPIFQLLLANGCGVDDKDIFQQTPLMLAASLFHADIVCNLVLLGADPSCVDGDGRTALDVFIDKLQSLADFEETLHGLVPTPDMLAAEERQRINHERIRRALGGPQGANPKRNRGA